MHTWSYGFVVFKGQSSDNAVRAAWGNSILYVVSSEHLISKRCQENNIKRKFKWFGQWNTQVHQKKTPAFLSFWDVLYVGVTSTNTSHKNDEASPLAYIYLSQTV